MVIVTVVDQYNSTREGLRRSIVARLVKVKYVEGLSSGLERLKYISIEEAILFVCKAKRR